jgi:mannosyl-glycoprotein endo-beta-N-acetylglucosaminidase
MLTLPQVLGTFITEFGQGKQRCNRLFSSRAAAQAVADQLVAVARHYGFEGWLVNIENSLSREQVQVMLHFLGYLRARMRAVCPAGMVVW